MPPIGAGILVEGVRLARSSPTALPAASSISSPLPAKAIAPSIRFLPIDRADLGGEHALQHVADHLVDDHDVAVDGAAAGVFGGARVDGAFHEDLGLAVAGHVARGDVEDVDRRRELRRA